VRFSSPFVARPYIATLSMALLVCGLGGTTLSQAATSSDGVAASLPGVVVDAPQTARPHKPKQHAVTRSTPSPLRSPASTPSISDISQMSPSEQLARIAKTAGGSCADGCQSSFRTGNSPWHGCSISGGAYSFTCRNVGNYKTYAECTQAGLILGWRAPDVSWYCTSLALK
jgi:hypothetical protein